MRSLRVRSRAKRKGLNRRARAKLWRSAVRHLAAANGFSEVVASIASAPVSEDAQPNAVAVAFEEVARGIIQGLRRESTFKAVLHTVDGLGAIVAARLVGRRPKAPMWWEGANA